MALISLTSRVAAEEAGFLDQVASQHEGILSKQGVLRLLLQQAQAAGWDPLDRPFTLAERTASEGSGASTSTSTSIKKRTTKSSSKSVQPPLHAHEDLIRVFWEAKAGSKSDAGWKLLNTELLKIQDRYGDRVVREQLEMAAANRWKGISLRNYEQYGVTAKKKGDAFDWDQLTGLSI